MTQSSGFPDRQVRLTQLSLLLLLIVAAVWIGADRVIQRSAQVWLAPPPNGAAVRLGKGNIEQISLSPDGRTIAIRTTIGLFVYRADDFKLLWQDTEQEIFKVGFSPDGRMLWGMTSEGLVTWDSTAGAQRLLFEHIWRETGGELWRQGPLTWAVAWEHGLPNTLAAPAPCGYQNQLLPEPVTLMCIDIIDLETGLLIEQLPTVVLLRSRQDSRPVEGQRIDLYLDYSALTGEFFMSVQDRLWVWDPARQLLTEAVPLPAPAATVPALSPQGDELAIAIGRALYVVGGAQRSLTLVQSLPDPISNVAYSSDGQRLLVGTAGGNLLEVGRITHRILARHAVADVVGSLASGQDPDTILIDTGQGRVIRWRLSTGTIEASLEGFLPPAERAVWSPRGDRLALVTRPNSLRLDDPRLLWLWDLDGNLLGQRLFGERIIDLAWSPDGETLVVGTASQGGTVQWLDADSLEIISEYVSQDEDLCGLAWAGDGRLATAWADLGLSIFDDQARTPSLSLEARNLWIPPGAACRGVQWSPDNTILAEEVANGSPLFWESGTGQPIEALNPDPLTNQTSTASVGWDGDGEPLIAGYNQTAGQRSLPSELAGVGQPTTMHLDLPEARLDVPLPEIPADMRWSPDGHTLAIAYGNTVEIVGWTSDLTIQRRSLDGHHAPVLGLRWSFDGVTLATYSLDGTLILWPVIDFDN